MSNESKHTPGPWRIGTPPPNGEQTIGDGKGLMVAVATTGPGVDTEANALLIAETPELLGLVRELIDYDVLRCHPDGGDYDVGQWGRRARAVLARVDGEATK